MTTGRLSRRREGALFAFARGDYFFEFVARFVERAIVMGLIPEHQRKLPFLPRRIAVVTSPSGAAVHDFLDAQPA